jgi:hypothetical protein
MLSVRQVWGCIQKFPDWPPGARTANGKHLSAKRCSCIAILWVSLVSFDAITVCVAFQRVFIVAIAYFFIDSVRKLLDSPPPPYFIKDEWRKCIPDIMYMSQAIRSYFCFWPWDNEPRGHHFGEGGTAYITVQGSHARRAELNWKGHKEIRLMCRRKDNIKIDLRKIRWKVVDWIHLAKDRDQWRAFVNTVMNLRVP